MRASHAIILLLLALCAFISPSCALRQNTNYQVIPEAPTYLLRSPNSHDTPFPQILRAYNGFVLGQPSLDLRPEMEIRVENAYYEKGFSRKGVKGFLGTEVARYEITPHGLHLLSAVPMTGRPASDLPVQNLISQRQASFHFYRLYFEILFDRKKDEHGSVLLAANSMRELNRLSVQLSDPEALCGKGSTHCIAFPEACSVSVAMHIVVNSQTQLTGWGSLLSSVVTQPPKHLAMKRIYRSHLTQVKMDPQDAIELGLPLLPGDHIDWN